MELGIKRNHVLFVANRSFGIVSSRMKIVLHFRERGWNVIFCGRLDQSADALRDLGCQLFDTPFSSGGPKPINDFLAYRKLKRTISEYRPTLIHNFNAKPVMLGTHLGRACMGSKVKILNTITGLGYAYEKGGIVQNVSNRIYSRILDMAETNIFQNEADRKMFIEKRLVSSSRSMTIVSSGVDCSKYSINKRSTESEKLRVAFIGRILWQKGFREFIDAARELRRKGDSIQFDVYGELAEEHPDGVSKEYVDQQIEAGTIQYHGFVQKSEEIYPNIDLLVFPSYYGEGVPRVVLEANACGIPAIVSQSRWVADVVVEGENGIIVGPRSSNEIVRAIARLDSDREELLRMGVVAREIMKEHFEQGKIIDRYLEAYRRFLGKELGCE